jgi:hypothetical protein
VLKGLIDAVRRKRGDLPAYSSLRVSQFLARNGISAVDHTPYSPDLAPADLRLFLKLKDVLKEKRFSDVEDIKSSMGGKN